MQLTLKSAATRTYHPISYRNTGNFWLKFIATLRSALLVRPPCCLLACDVENVISRKDFPLHFYQDFWLSDDELGRRHFRKDAAILGQDSGIDETLPSIPEESGDAIDVASNILAGVKQKPSNKVIKTCERKKLFSHKINRYVIFRMTLLSYEYTVSSFCIFIVKCARFDVS